MAAEPGFEPGLRDPKSPVLPLHNSAFRYFTYIIISLPGFSPFGGAEGRARTDMEVALQQFLRLSRLPIPPLRLERKTRFELATLSLARRCSTAEPLPLSIWCRGPESNWGHADFQSAALPTELPRHKSYCNFCPYECQAGVAYRYTRARRCPVG